MEKRSVPHSTVGSHGLDTGQFERQDTIPVPGQTTYEERQDTEDLSGLADAQVFDDPEEGDVTGANGLLPPDASTVLGPEVDTPVPTDPVAPPTPDQPSAPESPPAPAPPGPLPDPLTPPGSGAAPAVFVITRDVTDGHVRLVQGHLFGDDDNVHTCVVSNPPFITDDTTRLVSVLTLPGGRAYVFGTDATAPALDVSALGVAQEQAQVITALVRYAVGRYKGNRDDNIAYELYEPDDAAPSS